MCVQVAGVPAVLRWGGDLAEPLAVSNSVAGVFVKLVLIFGTLLDFVLAATTVNRWAMRLFDPGFDYKWTLKNGLHWAKVSLPSSIIAMLMALLIPRLESLTGLLNSIAGATLQITAIPLCLWISKTPRAREGVWFPDLTAQFIAGTVYGIVFTLTVFLAAVYSISQTEYIPQGNQTFWCDIVG